MASQGARIWLPNTEDFFGELVQFVTNAEQNRTACDSPDFYSRRLEEYERTLNVLTRRIAESFPMEQDLINNLEILLDYLNNLRRQFDALFESYVRACDQDLLEESYPQTICVPEYRGRVGRPSIHVTLEQLNVLHNEAGFRWADVSRILGISERTIRRRRQEFGLTLANCPDDQLDQFTLAISSLNISELLVSAGYPHLTISPQRRQLAFECCVQYNEVTTKRIPALDDMRKGLECVKVLGTSILDLLVKWPTLKEKLFPRKSKPFISLPALTSTITYEMDDDSVATTTKYFQKYLSELSERDDSDNQEKLHDLVLFWIGFTSLPTNASEKLVGRLLQDDTKILPEADTCPRVLVLPKHHNEYCKFRDAMDTTVKYGKYGFGKI